MHIQLDIPRLNYYILLCLIWFNRRDGTMNKHRHFFWCLAFLFIPISQSLAQVPDTIWTRHYGGNLAEYNTCVQQTSDGGFMLAGYTYSYGYGGADYWLVRTDGCGNSLWWRSYGGTSDDKCYSAQQTSDGGYILAGSAASFGGVSDDFWLVKPTVQGIRSGLTPTVDL